MSCCLHHAQGMTSLPSLDRSFPSLQSGSYDSFMLDTHCCRQPFPAQVWAELVADGRFHDAGCRDNVAC